MSSITAAVLWAVVYNQQQAPVLPIEIWDGRGQVAAMYELNGHYAFHVDLTDNDFVLRPAQMIELVNTGIDLVGNKLKPDHGLYMAVRADTAEWGPRLGFVIGLTYESIQAWQGAVAEGELPYHLIEYLDEQFLHVNMPWPDWVEDETVVWGYAWLIYVFYYDKHPWYAELIHDRPLPFDSGFLVRPTVTPVK